MKKSLPIILSILVIVSVTGNILFYSKLKSANTENKSLTSSLEESQETLESLESEQKDLEEQLNNLETERKGLEEERNTLESELEFLKSIEPMSVTMYALEDCDTYSKPDESSDKVTTVEKSASLHVTGRTSNDWYRVEWGMEKYILRLVYYRIQNPPLTTIQVTVAVVTLLQQIITAIATVVAIVIVLQVNPLTTPLVMIIQ